MSQAPYLVLQIPTLEWPRLLTIPSKRFRLLTLADTTSVDTRTISDFALAALERGMVWFSSWGPDCERFHDIVDKVRDADGQTDHKFAGPRPNDVIMTTWHDDQTLEETLDEFAFCSTPTDGFFDDSIFWLIISLGNSDWTSRANKILPSVTFLDFNAR